MAVSEKRNLVNEATPVLLKRPRLWSGKAGRYTATLPTDLRLLGEVRDEYVAITDAAACAKLHEHGCFGTFIERRASCMDGERKQVYQECYLTAEEALYLAFNLKQLFCKWSLSDTTDENFVQEFELQQHFETFYENLCERRLVYEYWRSRGFVVRSGFKFAVDYSVYDKHPQLTHALYAVRLLLSSNSDDNGEGLNATYLKGINRISGQVGKKLLACTVEKVGQPVGDQKPTSINIIVVNRFVP